MSKRITIAMSGGVDSSVAAYLCLKEGWNANGATMRLYCPPEKAGLPDSASVDAGIVCKELGIPHAVYDFEEPFRHSVMEYFVREYEAGHTPNPCIVCNKYLKFGLFAEKAFSDGADAIATGHYARIERDPGGRYLVKKAADRSKDQSYVLWMLPQAVLSKVILPLGPLTKPEVREIAEEKKLASAHKSESQDICFIPDGDYASFIIRFTGHEPTPGVYTDESGRILGPNRGIIHYTVGQRKGLGIALGHPMFVKSKDARTGQVVLTENDRLSEKFLTLYDVHIQAADRLDTPIHADVKIRYGQATHPATVIQTGEHTATVRFDETVRAPAIGQSCVFYDGDTVIGGGIIGSVGENG